MPGSENMDNDRPRMWSFEAPESVVAWSFDVAEHAPGAAEEPRSGWFHTTKLKIRLFFKGIIYDLKGCIPTADLCLEKVVYMDTEGSTKHKWQCKRLIPPAEQIREQMDNWSICLKFALYCLCTFILLLIVTVVPAPWPEADEYTRCEIVRPNSLLREPINTMSNLGYIWVGSYMLVVAAWDRIYYQRLLRIYRLEHLSTGPDESPRVYCLGDFPAVSVCLGLSAILVGITSMWHHACTSACPTSVYYDLYTICVAMTSVVLTVVLSLLFVLQVIRPRAEDKKQKVATNLVYIITFLLFAGLWVDYRNLLANGIGGETNMGFLLVALFAWTAICLVTIAVSSRRHNITPNYSRSMLGLLVFFLATGVAAWLPEDVFASCPVPGESIFQLHAYWHVSLSLVYLFLFLFFRTLSNKSVEVHGGLWAHIFLRKWEPPAEEEDDEEAHDFPFRESIDFQENEFF